MSRTRAVVLLAAALAAVLVAGVARGGGSQDAGARSVIFVNGDGMGAAQREAATLAQEGLDGRLAMDELPVLGLQRTSPDDPESAVTDSAAAATAWATGTRTSNGRISSRRSGDALVPLGREAADAGKATGLVTTAAVTDASPAAFFASVPSRRSQDAIAEQYLEPDGPDVVLGGGASAWSDELLTAAEKSGYEVLTDPEDLPESTGPRLLGLFAEREMWRAADEGEDAEYDPEVSLADMTAKALDVLSQDEGGFFLFVEEEAVDGMGHANNGTLLLEAVRALDEAVQVAREHVAENPDTLLVVTGDHETGGLAIEKHDDGSEDGPFDIAGSDRRFALDWSTGSHTSVPTPVTAQGPGSERLSGTYPNTHVHEVLQDALLGSG